MIHLSLNPFSIFFAASLANSAMHVFRGPSLTYLHQDAIPAKLTLNSLNLLSDQPKLMAVSLQFLANAGV